MNKNLVDLPTTFETLEHPEIDTFPEAVEWCLYQIKELSLTMDAFLHRRIKTRALGDHLTQVRLSVANAILRIKTFADFKSDDPRWKQLKQMIEELVPVVQQMRNIPFNQ